MLRFGKRKVNSWRKKSGGVFLVLIIVGSVMLGSLIATETGSSPLTMSVNPETNGKASSSVLLDPTATLNGFHMYNMTTLNIPSGGKELTLSYPVNWNVMALGLNFFNGTLQKSFFHNATTVTSSVTTATLTGYEGSISTPKVLENSTIYQAQFNITGMKVGAPDNWITANESSNSTYPIIDGNVGIAQRFFISNHASNLTILVKLMKLEGTTGDLTAELRSSTSDNKVGGLIKTATYAVTLIGTGSRWAQLTIPNVNLNPGYYFIVLHADQWLGSGGGYQTETTLSTNPTSPSPGWVSFDKGVNWQNTVNLTDSFSYYFKGFKLEVRVTPFATPSDTNLRINDFQVADNFIWNQSVWVTAPPSSFTVTSDYPISVLNFTYDAWFYNYETDNLLDKSYKVMVGDHWNTTAIKLNRNFTMMYINLGWSDLIQMEAIDNSTSTINLDLRLLSDNTVIAGTLNITACAQLTRELTLPDMDPSSLKYYFDYTHAGGPYNNVTLAETAITVGPIYRQIEDVYINSTVPGADPVDRSLWSYNVAAKWLFIYREAFTVLPEFTLLDGSLLNYTLVTFNNFTASVSTVITGSQPDTTPIASVQVVNSTSLLDLDGVHQANITVTAPNGAVINNSILTFTGGQYKFNWTLEYGAGVYGLKITSICDRNLYAADRWIGAATVNDFALTTPSVTLAGTDGQALTGNLTSGQRTLILANFSYVDHGELTFSGTVSITVYLGTTGETDNLAATWNATTKTYSATYSPPSVDLPTLLTIQVEAVDLKGRISTNATFVYLEPGTGHDIPQSEPSLTSLLELLFIALIVLIPLLTYAIERIRKPK